MPTTLNRTHVPPELAPPPAPYSFAVEVQPGARYVFTAGLVGVKPDGTWDADIAGQARQVFRNLTTVLAAAGMGFEHLVKLVVYLTDIADQPGYAEVRKEFWGDIRPALTLVVVRRLARAGIRLEIEAVAAKHD